MSAPTRRVASVASAAIAASFALFTSFPAWAQHRPWDPQPLPAPDVAEVSLGGLPEPDAAPIEQPATLPEPNRAIAPEIAEIMQRLNRLELMYAQVEAAPAIPPSAEATPAPLPAGACGQAVVPAPECDCSKCVGYDKGFYIKTIDGAYMLKVNAMLQTRYLADWRDLDPGDGDDGEFGFTLARAPVIFSGNVISPKMTYWLILQGSQTTGSEFVEEARINYEFENGLFMQIGRFRDPTFMRELDVSYARQLAVERSYQCAIFSTGIEEGVCLLKQGENLRTMAFINDGRHSGAATSAKDFYEDATDFAISAGLDWKLAGEWAQYGDFASWPEEPLAAFIGADVHYEAPESGDDVAANNLNEFIAWTVDATLERCGYMAFASIVQRYSLVDAEDIGQSGVHVMTGYQILPEKLEPFIRYEYIDFDGVTNVGSARTNVEDCSVNLVSSGVNWYVKRHSAKVTIEVMHAFDPIPVAAPLTGLLVDASGNDDQTVLRTQLQLFF
jgi:hypothetical protein